ncbi:ATP-NAD kinase-like domain-containing protein [Earliella scabrosa]|nr:ATP-NAD kinase-like domain-containing protein [Earliella scabrosa]
MPVLVIYNPVSGDRSSKALFDDHILPLLAAHSITPDRIVPTESPGHAGTIVTDFLSSIPDASQALPVTIILGSGDGTLHKLINTLNSVPTDQPLPRIHLALVPCGTANALYSSIFPPSTNDDPAEYKLKSVKAFVSTKHASLPLNLAVTVLSAPPITSPGQQHPSKRVAISAVVASTALHASILHDSEALRASDPSIERFKTAGHQNITCWYHASIYDPASRAFVQHESSTEDEPIVDLEGPFAYFLSTVNADRLEPAFKITPRGKDVTSPREKSAALDVVIVRPTQNPKYEMDSEETRAVFVEKAGAVLGAAYQDGAHVTTEGTGPTVVEYVRCGGWEWEPDDIDERAYFVCADGDILTIPKGGKATCTAATPMGDTTGFALYV